MGRLFNQEEEMSGIGDINDLREKVRQQGFALCKWGRMLNALIAVLEDKDIAGKDEVMMKVYERLRDSGALERDENLD